MLAAMGVPEEIGMGAVRFSLGRQTTDAEIDAVIEQLTSTLAPSVMTHMRALKHQRPADA